MEYMENDIFILGHCFNLFVKLNMNTFKINPLHYNSLSSYSFDCFLKLSKVELDTIQDEQKLKDFISAMRGGICGVMGNRYIKSQSQSQRSMAKNGRSPMTKGLSGTSMPITYTVMHYCKSYHIKILSTPIQL